MASLKATTCRLVFLITLIGGSILIMLHFFINPDNNINVDALYGLGDVNNMAKSAGKPKRNSRVYVRHRLVNNLGIIIADEQPDIDEIDFVNKKYDEDRQRRNKSVKEPENYIKKIPSQVEIIEHDPVIDQNVVPLSYKYYANANHRFPECNSETPIQKVALLPSHQTGNNVLSNILYRYGDFNNLYFALPKSPVFEYYWPLRFNPSHVDKSLLNKAKANILVNPGRNSEANLRGLLSSRTTYLTLLRDPVHQYRDIYEYAGMRRQMDLVSPNKTDDENYKRFIAKPLEYIDKILNVSKVFRPSFHLLKNPQLFDLGYEVNDYRTPQDLQLVLQKLDQQFTLVLLHEYMDESLVLLQRILCWQLFDMVYIRRQLRNEDDRKLMEKTEKEQIRKWNHEDFLLYQHFNKTLWKYIRQEGDPMFWNDVIKLQQISDEMDRECFEHQEGQIDTLKMRSNVSEEFRTRCERLALREKDYVTLLKIKQKQRIKEEYDSMIEQNYVTNGTSGKFLYAIKVNGSEAENIEKFLNGDEDITENKEEDTKEESEATILKL